VKERVESMLDKLKIKYPSLPLNWEIGIRKNVNERATKKSGFHEKSKRG
jgi:hypothetical protein